ncbi:hypothetical protein ACF0H5_012240 [Mactra antiquata]
MSEQDLLREAIQSVDLMEFPTYYQQQPMFQPSQQTMIQPQPLIQPVQQTSGGSIQDKQIALAVLKEVKEIKTLLYPLKDLCEMMAKKQQSCSVQFQAQEMKMPVRFMTETHHGQGRHRDVTSEEKFKYQEYLFDQNDNEGVAVEIRTSKKQQISLQNMNKSAENIEN